jgi:hypothetical protein
MSRILSHPFRLVSDSVATVEQSSDAANAEQLAVLILTKRGERPLVPTFGVVDPAFRGLDVADVKLGVALHGPPVSIVAVKRKVVDAMTEEVEVVYE